MNKPTLWHRKCAAVTGERVNLRASCGREIMIGNFNSTTKFEYGDPNEAPEH